MLKTIRVTLGAMSLLLVTLLFVDFTGTAASLWPWLAKAQFIPALLAGNVLAIVAIVAGTLIFGRIYCSIICPLGVSMDVVNWLRGHVGKKKSRINRFKYAEPWRRTRLAVLTVFAVLLALGLGNVFAAFIAGLIEPYSAYGRIASQIVAPAYDFCNNLLAGWSESQVDNYAFYRVAAVVSIPLLVIAIVTLIVIVVFAWRGGRDYCNTICPVGTVLGYLAKFSLLKPVIDTGKCINCGKCARNCKAKCINAKAHAIDYTRCVACMDCIGVCGEGAISYTARRTRKEEEPQKPEANAGRRAFLATAGMLASAAALHAAEKTTDGGLTLMKHKTPAQRKTKIVPAGAISIAHMASRCTGCQLCVQACPSRVLKPSLSLDGFLQPTLDYTEGYCDPGCTKCSQVCPTGAIIPVDEVEKSSIKIGRAVVKHGQCISVQEGVDCGACSSYCPAGAIRMVERKEGSGVLMPIVNDALCIGCGACEYHCPVGTVASMKGEGSAVHVEGIDVHRTI